MASRYSTRHKRRAESNEASKPQDSPLAQRRGTIQPTELSVDNGSFTDALAPQLDPAVAHLFRHDDRGRVLWYAAPPVAVANRMAYRPVHSAAYLKFRATGSADATATGPGSDSPATANSATGPVAPGKSINVTDNH
ncbi:hypothetical protein H4R33_004225 [Dimargaris cristalligena]|nr:hypothetical protein H4R33_004225 [Dimargaris cristalligena]